MTVGEICLPWEDFPVTTDSDATHEPARQPVHAHVRPEDVPELAERIAACLAREMRVVEPWVGVPEVAAWLGVGRATVYRHAKALGGVRIGEGPRAPIRFRLRDLEARFPRGWLDWGS